jgi:hypothetical protein
MRVLVLLTLMLFVFACEDVINLDVNYRGEQILVDGRITSREEKCQISLKTTTPFFNDEYNGSIKEAVVILFENNVFVDSLFYIKELDLYQTKKIIKAKLGNVYSIKVFYNGNIFSASDRLINRPNYLDSIDVHRSVIPDDDELNIVSFGAEESGIGDFYYWRAFRNDEEFDQLRIAEDKWVDGNRLDSFFIASEDDLFSDIEDDELKKEERIQDGDTIMVEQMVISPQTYEFLRGINFQRRNSSGSQFSTPPTNVVSNLVQINEQGETLSTDNSHGLFYCANIKSDTLVMEKGFRDRLFGK